MSNNIAASTNPTNTDAPAIQNSATATEPAGGSFIHFTPGGPVHVYSTSGVFSLIDMRLFSLGVFSVPGRGNEWVAVCGSVIGILERKYISRDLQDFFGKIWGTYA